MSSEGRDDCPTGEVCDLPAQPSRSIKWSHGAMFINTLVSLLAGAMIYRGVSDKPTDVITDQKVNGRFYNELQDPDSKLFQKALAAEPNETFSLDQLARAFNKGKQTLVDRLEAEKTAVEESMSR